MPLSDTEATPDGGMELVLKAPSNSDIGRIPIPIWDSSDPERAPPPLPLNPGAGSPKTRSNASPGIQAATASLAEKMRENAPSSYTINPMPLKSSPEKSLIKGQYHRRMQSLQPTSDTKSEFQNYLENRSPERKVRSSVFDNDDFMDRSPKRPDTSSGLDSSRNSPSPLYTANRYLTKPLLGENTPPSATMLALQTMQLPNEETKPAEAPKLSQYPPLHVTSLSEQIQSLTNIATSLQKEMSNLSRRSKDNATDLLSLKAVTNSRDEDIRKSLRELASNITSKFLDPDSASMRSATSASVRSGHSSVDSKPFDSSPNSRKAYTLPRVPSPGSFVAALERDLCGSPAPLSDGSASIALLEKVLREMATKEAQDQLLELVDEVKKRPAKDGSTKEADKNVTKMLEEILNLVKENPANRALVRSTSKMEGNSLDSTRPGPIVLSHNFKTPDQKVSLNDDIMSLLNRVRTSVAEGGGLTSEVKALVRELRGEVLGMGREIGRKLDEAAASKPPEDEPHSLEADEVAEIVREGLAELKEQMHAMIQEHQETLSRSMTREGLDAAEVFTAVKSAFKECSTEQQMFTPAKSDVGMEKEDILEAVREAWETYKPEIELQNFGLEREEILDCLSEGLKAYQPKHEEAVTYDQVLAAVQAGMQNFVPPPVEAPPSITREEVFGAVKECLESFELTIPEPNITKEDIFTAVSDAMVNHHASHEEGAPKMTRDDVFDAVVEAMNQKAECDTPNANLTRDDVHGAVVEAMVGQRALSQDESSPAISKDDVFCSVTEGLAAHFAAAKEMGESSVTREDVFQAVNEAFAAQPHATSALEPVLTREDIVNAISEALSEKDFTSSQALELKKDDLTREDVFQAVYDALAAHPPGGNNSLEPGLTREDIIDAISEGLLKQNSSSSHEIELKRDDLTKEDVFQAVYDALAAHPPGSNNSLEPGLTREDIIDVISEGLLKQNSSSSHEIELKRDDLTKEDVFQAVHDALDCHPSAKGNTEQGLTREDIIFAISEGLNNQGSTSKDIELKKDDLTREDVFQAVLDALASHPNAGNGLEPGLSREDIINAVSEGLVNQSSISREIEFNKEDLFEAVTSGLQEAAASSQHNIGDQVLDRLSDLLGDMKNEFKQYSAANGRDTEQVLDSMRDGLQGIKSDIESFASRAADVTGKEEVITTVKEGFRLLQADLERTINEAAVGASNSRGNPDTPELLDAMEKEFEHLRSTLSGLLIRTDTANDKAEILDAIHELNDAGSKQETDIPNVIEVIKEEFGNIRDSISMGLVKSGPTDKDEIISALQESFEHLQAEAIQKRDASESTLSTTSELLEAFNDGVDTIRADLEVLLHKSDEQSSTEVLDALKEGLASIKVEMEALRESQKEFEEASTSRGQELMLANEASSNFGSDMESLKALLTQLQTKVEAIEANSVPAPLPEDVLRREHLDEVLSAVRDVHGTVTEASSREIPVNADAARKEDTDVIETLLRDTVAKIEELHIPPPDDLAKSEQLLGLEVVVSELKDAIAEVAVRLETEGCTKAEIGTLETLMKDLWVAVEESKDHAKEPVSEETERVVKSDIQTVEAMLCEVKNSIEELKLPDLETLPVKADIEGLAELIASFKEKVDSEAELTAQAFEARKVEHGGIAEKVEEAKVFIADLRDELKAKLDGSEQGLSELKTLLEGLAVSSDNFSTVESVTELSDLITREFERARGEHEANKLETEERDAASLVKQDESRAAIIAEIEKKVDERVDEILSKYDDLHGVLEAKFSETEARAVTHVEHLTSTKGIAEDIKLIIGAMGNSVTESCERMGDDTKTLFAKVGESYNKMEDMHNEIKEFNEISKAELEKTSSATDRVETQILEYHPQILEAIKDILLLVGQHYEHSQKSNEELKMNLSAIPAAIPQMLPALPAPPEPREIIVPEKYDDTELHSKLDLIMNFAESTSQTVSNTDKLDEIHEKVMATSREITEMVATQSRLVVEDYERKKRESEEAAYALERRLAQQEKVESEILTLNDEKQSLLNMIQALKSEKEELTKQNARLGKELSGLETALDIRQREMEFFEERAQGLEKRILAGVFDHARSMIMKESGRSSKSRMSLRRIPSYGSTTTKTSRASNSTTTKDTRSLVSNGVEMVLKRRQPAKTPAHNGSTNSPNCGGKERRILSLSHVTGNRGVTDRHVTAPAGPGGLTNLKRSHSVRSNLPSRKTSWGTTRDFSANKENESFLEEEENFSAAHSDAGTERTTTTGKYSQNDTDETGSTISASRQPSYASTTNGLVAEHNGSILEVDDEDAEDAERKEHSYDSESERSDYENSEEQHHDTELDDEGDYQTTIDEQEDHSEVDDMEAYSELEPPPPMKIPGHNDSGIGSDMHRQDSIVVE